MSASTSSEEFEFEGSPKHQAVEDGPTAPEDAAVTATTAPLGEAGLLENPNDGGDDHQADKPSMEVVEEEAKMDITDDAVVPPANETSNSPTVETQPATKPSKAKPKATKSSKATKKTVSANKKPKSNAKAKKPAPKSTKKNASTNNKKAPTAKATTAKAKNGKANGTAAASKSKKEAEAEAAAAAASLELFTKHYREFERCLTRLEKVDLYRFFWDPAPEEFVEDYSPKKVENDGNDASKDDNSQTTENNTTKYPSHPPFNWEMVRKRHEHGRYVINIKLREKQRLGEIARCLQKEKKGDCSWEPPTISVMYETMVDWDLFKEDVIGMCNSATERNADDDGKAGSLSHAIKKILGQLDQIYERAGRRHISEVIVGNDRHQFSTAMEKTNNAEAAFQGKWRQTPFPERKYERLPHKNVVCAGLSELDERIASYELRTNLPDSFVGVSYKFEDDTGKSEGWMKSVLTETGGKKKAQEAAMALAEDEGVIRAQVTTCMEMLLIAVQDKCLTEADVLHQPELRSANWEQDKLRIDESDKESVPDIVEQPVWGIDCYTRRNVSICLETEFDKDTALVFIEKWLLPAINACPVDLAHDISNAAKILEGVPFESNDNATAAVTATATPTKKENGEGNGSTPMTATEDRWSHSLIGKSLKNKIETTGPPWLKHAARLLRRAREAMGPNFFRVHPKGHGSIVLRPTIKPNTLVTFYRGEVYPSWRWGEKMDAIDITQARKKLKPALPDFYNMALEVPAKVPLSKEQKNPSLDPSSSHVAVQKDRGYGLLFVDASRKAGHGSSVSHSCAPTCEVRVAAVGGELCLAMTTIRALEMGEELTFDYNAVTESLVEYRSAVCLCGFSKCRGSFLHFATADCYQKMLHRNAPVAVRFANLAKGCLKEVMSKEDKETLQNHGFLTAAFGAISFNRHKASRAQSNDQILDSMENVPVWLRTYVAETLRYIEYERRALPISLICEDLSKPNADATCTTLEVTNATATEAHQEDDDDDATEEADPGKPAKGSRPMPSFFFYCRVNDKRFRTILKEEEGHDEKDLPGLEHSRAIKRIAASQWKLLSAEEKAKWKKKSEKDWEKQNGQKLAVAEKKRKQISGGAKSNPKAKKKSRKSKESLESKFENSNVSFQAADAEGAAAMEQRIQQLTQSLSRVGRVLDRHREAVHVAENFGEEASSDTLRRQVHPPLAVASDEQIVAWLWNGDGIVPTLLAKIETEECVSPALKSACKDIKKKYELLDKYGCHWSLPEDFSDFPIKPRKARRKVVYALMEFRRAILKDLKSMARDLKKEKLREKALKKQRRQEEKTAAEADSVPTQTDEHDESAMNGAVSPKVEQEQTAADSVSAQTEKHDESAMNVAVSPKVEQEQTAADSVSAQTEKHTASAMNDAVSPKEEQEQTAADSVFAQTEKHTASAMNDAASPKEESQQEGQLATASPQSESPNMNGADAASPKEESQQATASPQSESLNTTGANAISPKEESTQEGQLATASPSKPPAQSECPDMNEGTPVQPTQGTVPGNDGGADSNKNDPRSPTEGTSSQTNQTKAATAIGSCESSTATPSLLVEDSGVTENPVLVSREVSSEVEASVRKLCVPGAEEVTASPIGQEGGSSLDAPMTSQVSQKAEELAALDVPSKKSEDPIGQEGGSSLDAPLTTQVSQKAEESAALDVPSKKSEELAAIDNVAMEIDSGKVEDVEERTQTPPSGADTTEDDEARMEVTSVLQDLVDKVVAQAKAESIQKEKDDYDDMPKPWLEHYGHRYKLQAAADLLLLYAKTSTFFLLQPYKPLKSTPIEVYAREIGNAVPRAAIDKTIASRGKPHEKRPSIKSPSHGDGEVASAKTSKTVDEKDATAESPTTADKKGASPESTTVDKKGASPESATVDKKPPRRKSQSGKTDTVEEEDKKGASPEIPTIDKKPSRRKSQAGKGDAVEEEVDLCEPDDIVAEVTVKYQGDYVMSQLLQWYNAGIGQSPGLPETLGCIRLPSMSGCWSQKAGSIAKTKMEKPTPYESKTRPALVKWFSDPYQRGSPWPNEVKIAFSNKGSADLPADTSSLFFPLGSPVLDLLVTGDDSNIHSILDEFGAGESKKEAGGLLSTLDEGRPAQAVSNWIQCEACLKWRRIPWHVDIDVLAKHFVCKNNKWNRASNNCEAPEDKYEEEDNDVVRTFSPGKKPKPDAEPEPEEESAVPAVATVAKPKKVPKPKPPPEVVDDVVIPIDESTLVPGARFDVQRQGKTKFTVGVVVNVTEEGDSKIATFHFPKTNNRFDECIRVGSSRIAPLYSKVKPPEKRPKKPAEEKAKQKSSKKRPRVENDNNATTEENLTAKVLDFTDAQPESTNSAPDGLVSSNSTKVDVHPPVDGKPASFSQSISSAPDGVVSSKPKAEVCPPMVLAKPASFDQLSSSAAAIASRCDDVASGETGQQTTAVASSSSENPAEAAQTEKLNPLDAGFIQKLKDKMKEEKQKEKEARQKLKKEKKEERQKEKEERQRLKREKKEEKQKEREEKQKEKEERQRLKQEKQEKKRKLSPSKSTSLQVTASSSEPHLSEAMEPTGSSKRAKTSHSQYLEQPHSQQSTTNQLPTSTPLSTAAAMGPTTFTSSQATASHPQVQQVEQPQPQQPVQQSPQLPTNVQAQLQSALAARNVPSEALDALASLVSLRTGASIPSFAPVATSPLNGGGRQGLVANNQFTRPLNNGMPRDSGASAMQNFASVATSPLSTGGRQNLVANTQFNGSLNNDMAVSSPGGTASNPRYAHQIAPQQPHYSGTTSNPHYAQQSAPQQPQYGVSRAYSAMDNPAQQQIQRMQEVRMAVDAELQRQRFQQRVHAEIAAEIQRQRGNPYFPGAPAGPVPNNLGLQPQQAPRRENQPDHRYGFGHGYYQNDRR